MNILDTELKYMTRDVISGRISAVEDRFTARFMNTKYTFVVTEVLAPGCVMARFEK